MFMQSLHLSVEDIIKLPQLIDHFEEHQENYGDDFLSFLNKHYGAQKDKHESEENDGHEELPFHHSQHLCIDLKIDLPEISILEKNVLVRNPEHHFRYQPPHADSATYSLFQPPKNNC